MFYRVLYIPGGAGFLPLTVWTEQWPAVPFYPKSRGSLTPCDRNNLLPLSLVDRNEMKYVL